MAKFLHSITLTLGKVGNAAVRKAYIGFHAFAQSLVSARKVLWLQNNWAVPAV
jgi:hypothetical protein